MAQTSISHYSCNTAKILLAFFTPVLPTHAVTRSIGGMDNPIIQECGGSNQTMYTHGLCPLLIRCVMGKLPANITSGMAAGSNIASLVPTIAALIGAPPMDLVQMALVSSHRALATCCYGIGLPSGLYRQLKPVLPRLGDKIEHLPRMREWVWQLPTTSSGRWQFGWRNALLKLTADIAILGFAALMLWYTWKINVETMVTWRCEYSVLLFLWPMVCMAWLIIAIVLLVLMKEKLEILVIGTNLSESTPLTTLQLMKLPYNPRLFAWNDIGRPLAKDDNLDRDLKNNVLPVVQGVSKPEGVGGEISFSNPAGTWPEQSDGKVDRPSHVQSPVSPASAVHDKTPKILIRVTMPDDRGLSSWRWYEALLETIAVGIYLYATFVLTSTLFLSGEMALTYAAIVTLCSSVLRIFGTLF